MKVTRSSLIGRDLCEFLRSFADLFAEVFKESRKRLSIKVSLVVLNKFFQGSCEAWVLFVKAV
jgi:hypothetical protein